MDREEEKTMTVGALSSFCLSVSKLTIEPDSPLRRGSQHIHDSCEIYVNLMGSVSYMVENHVYAIERGDIIITKPYEYHHCIYTGSDEHSYYRFGFPVDRNESFFAPFLDRENGQGNLIRFSADRREYFLGLCEKLLGMERKPDFTVFAVFVELLRLLAEGARGSTDTAGSFVPARLGDILSYLKENYTTVVGISDVAGRFGVNITTMERDFKTHLGVTPKKYVEGLRLSLACRLLHENVSVTQACFDSGFSDYSHFIALFRRVFHTTPLRYQKTGGNVTGSGEYSDGLSKQKDET